MTSLTRRELVEGGMALVSGGVHPSMYTRTLAGTSPDQPRSSVGTEAKTLIVLQLAGGNDGLNTVIPYADPSYRQFRPTLAIPEDQVIKLDGNLGLHPSLKALKPVWYAGHLAVVENVGYAPPNLSHFASTDVWLYADPSLGRHQGWLSPAVDGPVNATRPFMGLSLGSSLSGALCCAPLPPPSVGDINDYALQSDPHYSAGQAARLDALRSLYAAYTPPAPFATLMRGIASVAEGSANAIHDAVAQYQPAVTYAQNSLGNNLKLLASLISRDLGLRVGYLLMGGFDTHGDQLERQAPLLERLAEGLAAFQADLEAHGKAEEVVLMTWSEFGRRVPENASRGTDHGTGSMLFVMGARVKGGIYGDPPDLDNLDNGNLRFATDFRSVYATLLEGWLHVDSVAALGQAFPRLGFL